METYFKTYLRKTDGGVNMIKIEYETADFRPYMIEVKEADALDKMIEITKAGGHIHWVERVNHG